MYGPPIQQFICFLPKVIMMRIDWRVLDDDDESVLHVHTYSRYLVVCKALHDMGGPSWPNSSDPMFHMRLRSPAKGASHSQYYSVPALFSTYDMFYPRDRDTLSFLTVLYPVKLILGLTSYTCMHASSLVP